METDMNDTTPAPPAADAGGDPGGSVPAEAVAVLQGELRGLKDAIQQRDAELAQRLQAVTPPPKDSLDSWLESLPDGPEGSKEAMLKADAALVAPILKSARHHIIPEVRQMGVAMRVLVDALDRVRFENDQLRSTLPPEKVPAGLKHMDKIEAVRREEFEKSGGRTILRRQDAFERVLQDIRAQEKKAPPRPSAPRPAKTVYERVQGGLDRGEDFGV